MITAYEAKCDAIRIAFAEIINDYSLIVLWNSRCESYNCYDDRIEDMDFFNEVFCDTKPLDVINRVGRDFNPNDKYFTFDGYGFAQSFDYLNDDHSPYDEDSLIDWITEHPDEYGVHDELDSAVDIFVEHFVEYYNQKNPENPTTIEAVNEILNVDSDFIDEDWDTLVERINNPEE